MRETSDDEVTESISELPSIAGKVGGIRKSSSPDSDRVQPLPPTQSQESPAGNSQFPAGRDTETPSPTQPQPDMYQNARDMLKKTGPDQKPPSGLQVLHSTLSSYTNVE
ncbi:hypothetical protein WR25_02985 [Diploscapter pachys]|uniref:Uncharacterized protein n=1 Tax=Diploscapter pachys TaxID=2018661 RepID=A0A2A2K3J1_9BILA|nr:hypothetical protein WR25_02985 [Diploscapter pachys]